MVYRETFTESTVSCVFLNQSDTSEKTCCVTHRLCDQKILENTLRCNKDSTYNNVIELEVYFGHLSTSQKYCYAVIASNDTYTVKVEGTFTLGITNFGVILIVTHDYNIQVTAMEEVAIQLQP